MCLGSTNAGKWTSLLTSIAMQKHTIQTYSREQFVLNSYSAIDSVYSDHSCMLEYVYSHYIDSHYVADTFLIYGTHISCTYIYMPCLYKVLARVNSSTYRGTSGKLLSITSQWGWGAEHGIYFSMCMS